MVTVNRLITVQMANEFNRNQHVARDCNTNRNVVLRKSRKLDVQNKFVRDCGFR